MDTNTDTNTHIDTAADTRAEAPAYVGIDVGGTFTDFVVWQDGGLRIHKVPTTPDDQSRAILQGLHELGLIPSPAPGGAGYAAGDSHVGVRTAHLPSAHPLIITHGMTVATNALLERRGAA